MASQIYNFNEETNLIKEEYPRITSTIEVISMFPWDYIENNCITINNYAVLFKYQEDFIRDILPGDKLLFEYPAWFDDSRYGTGLKVFSVDITNLRTMKTIKVKAPKVQYIYKSIERYAVDK